ncbi:fibrillin-2 [Biomphalaria glabrata]|nr:fibrillin-2 [Biomphalaria glabrata]
MLSQVRSMLMTTVLLWWSVKLYAITSADFDTIKIGEHVYCLSKNSTSNYHEAKNNCTQIKAELAFFDSNEEFFLAFKTLNSYQKEYWIDYNYTRTQSTIWKYIFSWRQEIFNDSVWATGQPDGNCGNTSFIEQCCGRVTPYEGLKDMKCSSTYALVCKSVPQCPLHAVGCILNCGEPVSSLSCLEGFDLNATTQSCEDVNECAQNISRCHQSCSNTVGSYTCGCFTGYTLASDNVTCVDIDECALNQSICPQKCENKEGSFRCTCNVGFTLRVENNTGSVFCDDIDECKMNTSRCQQTCLNTIGSYSCSCRSGYVLALNNYTCEDLNECALNQSICPQICENNEGSFQCTCNVGFALRFDNNTAKYLCDDIDECKMNTSGCHQTCLNTPGSYTCGCRSGYVLALNNYTCDDLNECLTNNGSCQQICQNFDGSFRCDCHQGYILGADNKSCDDIDECSSGVHKCQQNCSNANGSYVCSCGKGYLPSSDGYNCTQVETCLTSTCQHLCSNTSTGYTCHCYPGFKLDADGIHCSDINECDLSTCTNCSYTNVSNSCPIHCNVSSTVCDQVCDNVNGSFQCSCRPGYILDIADNKTCKDIDECSLNSSLCEVFCINTPGSYFCSCPQGFQLSGNSYSCEKNTLANYCPCSCLTTKIKDQMNKEQLAVYLKTLTKSLQVSKGDLLSHRLTLTTQKDDRPTSSILGYIGIVTMTFVFGTIILPEVLMLTVEVIHKIRNLF